MLQRTILAALTTLVGATAACPSFPIEASVSFPVPGGYVLDIEFHGPKQERTFEVLGSPATHGECVEVSFLDAKGNPVGTPQTVRIPGTGDVPSDATDFRLERVDCEEEEEDAGDGILAPGIAPGWVFAGGPIEPGASSSTRAYSMTVAHVDRERAQEIRDEVLAGGLALPIPPNVRIHHHSTSELVGTDLVLTLADDESFESLTLAVNGNPAYATLDDALLFTRRNWSVAVLRVPQDDLDYDPAPGAEWSNDLRLRYEVTEQGLHRARGAFTYTQ